jgi:hypothetical protein
MGWRAAVYIVLAFCTVPGYSADEIYRDADTGILFPETIGSFYYENNHVYDTPEQGYSLRYRGLVGAAADIYVYDFGFEDIPDGIDSDIIQYSFEEAVSSISAKVDTGDYLQGRDYDLPYELPADFLSRCFLLEFSQDNWKQSCLLVRGMNGKIFKVRISVPATDIAAKNIQQFAEALLKFLRLEEAGREETDHSA